MFCVFNPLSLNTLFKQTAGPSETLKLRQYLSLALQHSILAFKGRRNVDETQPSLSQKSFSTSKITQNQEKSEKSVVQVGSERSSKSKIDQTLEEVQKKDHSASHQNSGRDSRKEAKKFKRKIIRKVKSAEQGAGERKQEKNLKTSGVRIDLVSFAADIPVLKKISPREISRKMEELKRRSVQQWQLVDPEMLRRRRFIKQML